MVPFKALRIIVPAEQAIFVQFEQFVFTPQPYRLNNICGIRAFCVRLSLAVQAFLQSLRFLRDFKSFSRTGSFLFRAFCVTLSLAVQALIRAIRVIRVHQPSRTG